MIYSNLLLNLKLKHLIQRAMDAKTFYVFDPKICALIRHLNSCWRIKIICLYIYKTLDHMIHEITYVQYSIILLPIVLCFNVIVFARVK